MDNDGLRAFAALISALARLLWNVHRMRTKAKR